MHAVAENGLTLIDDAGGRSTIRHPVPRLPQGAENGTYAQPVPANANADPRVQAFATFVKRAIDEAVADGLSIDDIEAKTGVGRSTFYRWTRAESASPDRRKVQAFCRGLDIPTKTAGRILGWDGSEPDDDDDPAGRLDPDVLAVQGKLEHPDTTPEQRDLIKRLLRSLAEMPKINALGSPPPTTRRSRGRRRGGRI